MELRIYAPIPEPTADEERQRIRFTDQHQIVDYDDWVEEENILEIFPETS